MKSCTDRDIPLWLQRFKASGMALAGAGAVDGGDGRLDIFCHCRKPWTGEFMIQCDGCAEWFHGKCVDITPQDALSITEFMCNNCKD